MAVLGLLLAAACGFDYWKRKIPNALVALIAVAGMLFWLQREGPPGVLLYLGKAAAVMGLLYLPFKTGAIGAGDVKLLGVAAGYFPFKKIFLFSFISMLAAAIISLVKLLVNKNFRERLGVFFRYLEGTVKKGELQPYPAAGKDRRLSVCLSGPVLLSLILYLGGAY